MKVRGNFLVSLAMLLFFSGMLACALAWSGNSLRFPLLISLAGIACTVSLLIADFFAARTRSRPGGERPSPATAGPAAGGAGTMIAWFLVLFGTTVLLGFWVGSALFMVAFLRLFGRERWTTALGITALLVAVLYLILSVAMKMPVYGGYAGLTPY